MGRCRSRGHAQQLRVGCSCGRVACGRHCIARHPQLLSHVEHVHTRGDSAYEHTSVGRCCDCCWGGCIACDGKARTAGQRTAHELRSCAPNGRCSWPGLHANPAIFLFFCTASLRSVDYPPQVSHWGSKLAICRALTTLCADASFAQSLFRSTGLATIINVIRSVSTTSGRNAYPSAGIGFAPASPLKTAKQTPSLTGSGRVVGEVRYCCVLLCNCNNTAHQIPQVPHSPSIERRSDFLLPSTPWLSSGVRLGTAEPRACSKGVIHHLTPATDVRLHLITFFALF
jgi:hypothetical protein